MIWLSVTVKGREVGQLPNGAFFSAQVPAGAQVVAVEHGEWSGSRVFDFDAKGTYYVKFEYSLGRVSLRFVKEEEARQAITSLPNSGVAGAQK